MRTGIGVTICIVIGFAVFLLEHFNNIIETVQNVEWLITDQDQERGRLATNVKQKLDPEFSRLEKLIIEGLQRGESDGFSTGKTTKALLRDFRKAVSELKDAGTAGKAAIQQLLHDGKSEKARAVLAEFAEDEAKLGAAASKRAADHYRQIGALAFFSDTQAAIYAYKRATELDPNDPTAWNQLGQLHERIGSFETARYMFRKILSLAKQKNSTQWEALAYGHLGLSYWNSGNLYKAEQMLFRDLDLSEQLGDEEGVAAASGNLGLVYQRRSRFQKAFYWHKRQLLIARRIGKDHTVSTALGNLAAIHLLRNDVEKAQAALKNGIQLDKNLGNQIGEANKTANLGVAYLKTADKSAACVAFSKAHGIFEKLDAWKAEVYKKVLNALRCHKS